MKDKKSIKWLWIVPGNKKIYILLLILVQMLNGGSGVLYALLLRNTVREAVAFADKTEINDDERISKALKIACADEFVSELENGVDTLLGERGTGLSEGQTQRIAIARAVFSESPVLILDEATSSLDIDTERKLLENLRLMTDKTVIIVTHRPAALTICDRVVKFTENGVEEVFKNQPGSSEKNT